jgi:hypothetical protein
MFCTHLNYKLNWSIFFRFNCACVVKPFAGQTEQTWHSLACAVKTEGKIVRMWSPYVWTLSREKDLHWHVPGIERRSPCPQPVTVSLQYNVFGARMWMAWPKEEGVRAKHCRIPSFACVPAVIVGRSVYVSLSFVLDCYLILDQSDSTVSRFRKLKMKNRLSR